MDGENIAILVMQIFVAIMMLTIFATIIVQLQVIGRIRNYFTPIQKEIRDEERTIKQIEAQKVDIQRLSGLKKKREALFEEEGEQHTERVKVYRNGVWSEPVGEKTVEYRLRYNGVEINKGFATENEAIKYASLLDDEEYFDAEVWSTDEKYHHNFYDYKYEYYYNDLKRAESNESYGDISADPTTMPASVNSPHECPSCHTEAMMHYPGFKGYDWFCHNCQYKYQYGRN